MKLFPVTMKNLRLLLALLLLSLGMGLSARTNISDALDRMAAAVEEMADDNGVTLKVTHTIDGDTLNIVGRMTYADDSVDFIGGVVDRKFVLTQFGPALARLLCNQDEIKNVYAAVIDQSGAKIEFLFPVEEIIAAADNKF